MLFLHIIVFLYINIISKLSLLLLLYYFVIFWLMYLQADTIGESFRSLIHEDDCEVLDELPELLIANQRKEHMFAVRMKTSMSPTIRSKSKRTYKVG